jgi:hypothetical protein
VLEEIPRLFESRSRHKLVGGMVVDARMLRNQQDRDAWPNSRHIFSASRDLGYERAQF